MPPLAKLHPDLIDDYSVEQFVPALKGVLLSRSGIFIRKMETAEPILVQNKKSKKKDENKKHEYQQALLPIDNGIDLYLGVCEECKRVIQMEKQTPTEEKRATWDPPMDAIANGNWIGYLPPHFAKYTRSDEQCICLMMMVIYLSTIAGSKTVINSHHYIIHNHRPIIECFPRTVSDSVRMTLVGAFTKPQEIMQRKRFEINHRNNKAFLETFLLVKNILYIKHRELYVPNQFEYIPEDGAIVDRQDTSDYPVNPSIVRVIQFNNTNHNISEQQPQSEVAIVENNDHAAYYGLEETPVSTNEEVEQEPVITEATNYLFKSQYCTEHSIPGLSAIVSGEAPVPASTSGKQDLLVYNSNKLPAKRTIDNFVYCFPFLYVYGRGGYGETRDVHMSEEHYLLRLLRLHEGNFASHYAFLPAAFDVISTKKAFIGQFLSMNVNKSWIKTGAINKSMLVEAVNYQHVSEKTQKQGITVSILHHYYNYECH